MNSGRLKLCLGITFMLTYTFSVLPTKVCFEVKEIREVIQKNSSNDFISTKL